MHSSLWKLLLVIKKFYGIQGFLYDDWGMEACVDHVAEYQFNLK